jgi:hypothetical protein
MFVLKDMKVKNFKELYDTQRLGVTTMNVFFQNIRVLKTRAYKYISLDTYKEFYLKMMDDIEITSSPIDTIVPNTVEEEVPQTEQEEFRSMFTVNTLVPEYKMVTDRVTLEDMYEYLPATNSTCMKMKEHPEELPLMREEVFMHFLLTKYLQCIDQIHLELISVFTETIEYVVKNVSEKVLKDYIHKSKIDFDKTNEKLKALTFSPEYRRTVQYYSDPHGDIPIIDVEKLMGILFTNSDSNTDDIITVALYHTLSYAINDIESNITNDNFPHVMYIRDVLSKIK